MWRIRVRDPKMTSVSFRHMELFEYADKIEKAALSVRISPSLHSIIEQLIMSLCRPLLKVSQSPVTWVARHQQASTRKQLLRSSEHELVFLLVFHLLLSEPMYATHRSRTCNELPLLCVKTEELSTKGSRVIRSH